LQAQLQGVSHRLVADEFAALVAKQLALGDNRLAGQGKAEPDETDRLVGRTSAWTGNAVTARERLARECASAPAAISSTVSRDTAPCASSVSAETPSISIWLRWNR